MRYGLQAFAKLLVMKVAIIGPTHPYKGGIVQQTAKLAAQLTEQGHDVSLFGWHTQYPFFYPGVQFVPEDRPDAPVHPSLTRTLSWKNPFSWYSLGKRLKNYDKVIFVWWVPTIQGPVYRSVIAAMGRNKPSITVICHNVLPHESRPGDSQLAKSVLNKADRVVVHTPAEAVVAERLGIKKLVVTPLPFYFPGAPDKPDLKTEMHNKLLFFGFVRPYKGLDVLIDALAKSKQPKLTIAGEFWGGTEAYEEQIHRLGLDERIKIINRYLTESELGDAIRNTDAVVMPYKSGSGSQHVQLAHSFGAPVIVTDIPALAANVREGVDGLICKPDDADSLATAINNLYADDNALKLFKGVKGIDRTKEWQDYAKTVTES